HGFGPNFARPHRPRARPYGATWPEGGCRRRGRHQQAYRTTDTSRGGRNLNHDRAYLRHILEAIEKIERYTADGQASFRADEKTQDAVIRNFEIIGEAVKNLSAALKETHAEIPWKKIGGKPD